ncbi:hypothetical protein HanRHA438_Chr17g0825611 [Helianthus annuus]|nr:hypothetical protein HanHA89_Chr17g0716901 [Helianthus annuus]KAJ0633327.1 hypothetical protein HanLR1_Chr17g0675421 [Helianthus annuus]KAJ0668550.1 hypothetical protein HanPI659440_Chr17g0690651 [Helianthus annuus]KAJ0827429.1 hypothetical protein HanRHA438_Chr17g0825611 [Helianthus annuus]
MAINSISYLQKVYIMYTNMPKKRNEPDNFGVVLFVIVKGDDGDGPRRGYRGSGFPVGEISGNKLSAL